MTADQRAELLKRVVQDDVNEKLSYKDCEKIAKDLNLTLEQVSLSSNFNQRMSIMVHNLLPLLLEFVITM